MSTQQSATLLRLQDKIMAHSMAQLRQLACAAPDIIEADRVCAMLNGDGIYAEIVDTFDQDACTVCVAVQAARTSTVALALDALGYSFTTVDQWKSDTCAQITWALTIGDRVVHVAVMHPITTTSTLITK